MTQPGEMRLWLCVRWPFEAGASARIAGLETFPATCELDCTPGVSIMPATTSILAAPPHRSRYDVILSVAAARWPLADRDPWRRPKDL